MCSKGNENETAEVVRVKKGSNAFVRFALALVALCSLCLFVSFIMPFILGLFFMAVTTWESARQDLEAKLDRESESRRIVKILKEERMGELEQEQRQREREAPAKLPQGLDGEKEGERRGK